MSASREAISRASIRTATSSPAGSRLPERDEASSASQSLLAPAAGAPARLAAFENLVFRQEDLSKKSIGN